MMKKFMNAPETVTDELLVGLGLAHSDILDVDGHLVISKDLKNADRVTIVTCGGSGHEPAQAGFVGKGMLDIQVVGDIFAAPNGQLVFEAMKMADKGHGVLLLTLNYAGDQLACKQAMKLAKKVGMNFRGWQTWIGRRICRGRVAEDGFGRLAGPGGGAGSWGPALGRAGTGRRPRRVAGPPSCVGGGGTPRWFSWCSPMVVINSYPIYRRSEGVGRGESLFS